MLQQKRLCLLLWAQLGDAFTRTEATCRWFVSPNSKTKFGNNAVAGWMLEDDH